MPNSQVVPVKTKDKATHPKANEKVIPTTLAAPPVGAVSSAAKETEPGKTAAAEVADIEEEKLMAEIRTTAEAADKQALEAIQESVKEVKRSHFEPELPPDVEDAGVINPQKAAEEVVINGPTIDLPIDEAKYKQGLKVKVSGKVDNKKVVVGPSSLAAFAIWVGRILKLAHKHTMRVVFKKEVGK
ncbi:MAG TPA: hypothetical protein VLE91_02300 [Candidatus Saccharimonadales bacterium]|nr:hypothetical protein [Candidatus Saccharimonadales bacterium]